MWVFTKHGFFSAVANENDINLIHVRARFRGDLQKLAKANGVKIKVKHTPHNDYAFRADFKRHDWSRIMFNEASGIDYVNFKNEVHDGTERDWTYMDVWMAMRRGQEIGNRH